MPNFAFFKGLDDAKISQKQVVLFPLDGSDGDLLHIIMQQG